MKLFFLFCLFCEVSLSAFSINQENILGIWTIESSKSNGFVEFGEERASKRGVVWQLRFTRDRRVQNLTTGTSYGFYLKANELNLYKKSISQYGDRYSYATLTKVTNKRKITFLRELPGIYSGCLLIAIQRDIFTQYKNKRRYIMCKKQNEAMPVKNADDTQQQVDIFR